jgi:hypothetical protein
MKVIKGVFILFLWKYPDISSKKNSQINWEFYNKETVDYLLLSLILAFLPVSSLK